MNQDRFENASNDYESWNLKGAQPLAREVVEIAEGAEVAKSKDNELRPMEGHLDGDMFECYYGALHLN